MNNDVPGRHRHAPPRLRNLTRRRQRALTRILVAVAVVITVGAAGLVAGLHGRGTGDGPLDPRAPPSNAHSPRPGTLLGVYRPGVPGAYAGLQAFPAPPGSLPVVGG